VSKGWYPFSVAACQDPHYPPDSSCIDGGRFVIMQGCVRFSRRRVESVVYAVLPRLGIIG